MKKILQIILILTLCHTAMAQPPMGGGRPPEGGRGRGGRPPMMQQGAPGENNPMIMGMPDIPGLTLEQREKLSKAISQERKDISKLMMERQGYKIESDNPGISGKDRMKLLEKIEKIDEKKRKKEEEYDKKYRTILTEEQYRIFSEKKKDIEFGKNDRMGRRPSRRNMPPPPNEAIGMGEKGDGNERF